MQYHWEIDALKTQMHNKAEKYEIYETNSNVVSLEREIGEIRSSYAGICSRLEILERNNEELKLENYNLAMRVEFLSGGDV